MPLKSEYNKERARVEKLAKKLEKQGYTFGENILPPIPKRPTSASIRRIAKINLGFLRARAITQPEPTAAPSIKRSSISQRKVKAPEIPKPTKTATEYTAKGKQQARPELDKFRKIGRKPYIPHPRSKQSEQLVSLKNFMRNAEKRGFQFQLSADDLIKKEFKKHSELYQYATYVDPETGELLTGLEGRALEKQRAARKVQDTKKYNAGRAAALELIPETPVATAYPTEEEISYNNLMSLLRSVSDGSALLTLGLDYQYKNNATLMLNCVDRAIDTVGLRAFLEMLKTPDGEYLLLKAYDGIFASTEQQAREWCSYLEHWMHRNNFISDAELREIQNQRDEKWGIVH